MYKDYSTPRQIAAEKNLSIRTVYRMCESGLLPAFRVGGRWRISNEKNADMEDSEAILRQIREGMKKSGW